ncbi:MAG: HAD-IIIA family hydrolase [Deltaproteobacteria bacterium]|nr:HAD-IIIA family hydrolase [Deltaproteobacteria bacterium]
MFAKSIRSSLMKEKLKKIKMLLLDVDGVLTDGRVIMQSNDQEIIEFSIYDGVGIVLLKKAGFKVGIISGRNSQIIHKRGEHLGIDEVHTNKFHKIDTYKEILKKYKFQDEEICYIGDELLDLPILERVGFSAAPKNAISDVKEKVDYVTEKEGGHGAVREVIELILKETGQKEALLKKVLKYS